MATATKTYLSYSASPSLDFAQDRRIQVSAWADDSTGLLEQLEASDSAKFHRALKDDATRYLTDRGCDPMLARVMVEVASHGFNRVEVWPASGRVDVGGERR